MGRRRKNPPPPKDSPEAEVSRPLTEEEINTRSRRLAQLEVRLDGLEKERKAAAKRSAAEIKETQEEVRHLAREVVEGVELLRQGDLFAPGKAAAQEALAHVAAAAGEEPAEAAPAS